MWKKEKFKKTIEKIKIGMIVFGLSFISFYTSYSGLLKISGSSDKMAMLFMAILVGMLQYILVFSINKFYIRDIFKKDWIKALLILSAYLITTTISVAFSFSFWYETFSAENYSKRSSALQLNKVRDSLVDAKNSFQLMGSSLMTLSTKSASTSEREKKFGRTCNPNVGSGEGVYTWLRADDSMQTKKYSEEIMSLQSQLDEEIVKVSSYLQKFDPKGDVVAFNREVNNRIKEINIKFFQSPILGELMRMLIERSGANRQHITVIHRYTGHSSTQSCMDREFTDGAKRVIGLIANLKNIEGLHFFDIHDKNKLFARTTSVLFAIFNPSVKIKSSNDMENPDDITDDDIKAVSAGFIIDLLILIITLYAKEGKDETIELDMDNPSKEKLLNIINPYLAEISRHGYFVALPKEVEIDRETARLRQLILTLQEKKLVRLVQNEVNLDELSPYFHDDLRHKYSSATFKVYKIELDKILLMTID
jgi:hypothetical protein